MAIDTKSFIDRINIRTMKKDIQKLKEIGVVGVVKKSEKIITTSAVKQTATPEHGLVRGKSLLRDKEISPTQALPKVEPAHNAFGQLAGLRPAMPAGIADAGDGGKSKILPSAPLPKAPAERSKILEENKLSDMAQDKIKADEQKMEQNKKVAEPLFNQVPPIPTVSGIHDKVGTESGQNQNKENNQSVKANFSSLVQENNTRQKQTLAQTDKKTPLTEKTAEQEQNSANSISPLRGNKEYLKGISPIIKEKLAESAKIEEKQRKKFMEDIEEWASSSEALEDKKRKDNN